MIVGPLDEDQCIELLINLSGRDNEVVRRRGAEMARETGGNPFLLVELAGCFDPDTDSFQPLPVGQVIAQKLTRLPAAAGAILKVVAVSGRRLPVDEAILAAEGEDDRGVDLEPHAQRTAGSTAREWGVRQGRYLP